MKLTQIRLNTNVVSKLAVPLVVLLTTLIAPQQSQANSYKAFDCSPVRTVKVTGWQDSLTHTEGNLNQFYWTPIVKRYRDPNAVKLEPGHKYAKYGTAPSPINPHSNEHAMVAHARSGQFPGSNHNSSVSASLMQSPRASQNTSAKMLSYSSYGTGTGASYQAMGSGSSSSLSGKLLSMNSH